MKSETELRKYTVSEENGQELLVKYRVLTKLAKHEVKQSANTSLFIRYRVLIGSLFLFILIFVASQLIVSRYLKTIQKRNASIYELEKQVKACSELLDYGRVQELLSKINDSILLANRLFIEYGSDERINRQWAKLIVTKFYAQTVRYLHDESGSVKKPSLPSLYTYDRINATYPEYSDILSMIHFFTVLTELQKDFTDNPYNEKKVLPDSELKRAKIILEMLKKDLLKNATTIKVDFNQFYSFLKLNLDSYENDLEIWDFFWHNYINSYFINADKRTKTINELKTLFPNLEILRDTDELKTLSIAYWSGSYFSSDFWDKLKNLLTGKRISVKLIKYDNMKDLMSGWFEQAFDICIVDPYFAYDFLSSSSYSGIAFFDQKQMSNSDFSLITYMNTSEMKEKAELSLLLNPERDFEEIKNIYNLSESENPNYSFLKGKIKDIDFEAIPEKMLKKIQNKNNDFTIMRTAAFRSSKNNELNAIPIIDKTEDYIVFSSLLLSDKKQEKIKSVLLESELAFEPFSYLQLENYYAKYQPSPLSYSDRIFINSDLDSDEKEKLLYLILVCGLTPVFEESDSYFDPLLKIEANLIKVREDAENQPLYLEFTVKEKNNISVYRTDIFRNDDPDILEKTLSTLSEIGMYGTVIEADPGKVIARMSAIENIQEKTLVEFFRIDYSFDYNDSIRIHENVIKTGEGLVVAVYKNLFVAKRTSSDTNVSRFNLVRIKK
ncbi:MAG: hypothetical protein PHR06_10570 [Candidatus Cloacimonetes bacterium]|nr:hypothetical protein [Candidatus Cloacimonadota bacterium]